MRPRSWWYGSGFGTIAHVRTFPCEERVHDGRHAYPATASPRAPTEIGDCENAGRPVAG